MDLLSVFCFMILLFKGSALCFESLMHSAFIVIFLFWFYENHLLLICFLMGRSLILYTLLDFFFYNK